MPSSDQAYEKAARSILCDCGCHPQSVLECACSRADAMRQEMAAEARAGKSAEEIIAGYVARSGESILVVPKAEGFNLLAWLGPGAALVISLAAITLLIRRWRRSGAPPSPGGDGSPRSPAPDADLARLRRAIDEL
jgi:cytochrome c-type biogenesis protein CcmH/NrfF